MRARRQPDPTYGTIPDAAKRLGIGRRQLVRAIDAGDVAAYQVGGWRRVKFSEVEAWLRSTRVQGG